MVIVDTSENWTRTVRLHSGLRQGPVAVELDRVAGPTGAGRTTDDLGVDQPLSD